MPAKVSRRDLLAELHRLAEELGRTPTRNAMNEHGEYSRSPYDTEFGSWNEALAAAGFEVNKPVKLDREDLLAELERLADEIGESPTMADMRDRGRYSDRAYKREFGTWNDALRAAGLDVNKRHDVKETLTCEWCGEEYQVKPALEDDSRFCSQACLNAWKSEYYDIETHPHPNAGKRVSKECEWCGAEFEVRLSKKNSARFCSLSCLGKHNGDVRSGENSPRWRGGYEPYYGPNWRKQRRKAKERDDYECQRCGATEDLAVHHKTAFREFVTDDGADYEAAHKLDNLVTVCRPCHAKIENGAGNGFGGN